MKRNIECKRYYAYLSNVISIPLIKRTPKSPPLDMYVLCVFRFMVIFILFFTMVKPLGLHFGNAPTLGFTLHKIIQHGNTFSNSTNTYQVFKSKYHVQEIQQTLNKNNELNAILIST